MFYFSQYSTCTFQNDNFINYIFGQTVRRVAVLTYKQEQQELRRRMSKVFLLQCNLSTDLLVFIKLKFLRILNFSQSFQDQVMTCSSCNYTIWERKKTGYSHAWIYFNNYFCITYLIWFMTSYTMRRTFVPSKVSKRPKLRGVILLDFLRGARTSVYQSNCIDILAFCIGAVFTEKNGTYFNHELIFQLIPTSIWYDLLTVSQIWPSNYQNSYFF